LKKCIIFLVLFLCSCSFSDKRDIKEHKMDGINRTISVVETVLGESTTKIIDNGANRINNIQIACQKISGIKLASGEEFSFNKITGKKTAKNGYKSAPVLVDGEKSYGVGGGVCQVSTTIYMAAKSANLDITEHHNHSEPVAYAANGMDATVVYGIKDFKFKNNSDDDIYIYVWIKDSKVVAKIIRKGYKVSNTNNSAQ